MKRAELAMNVPLSHAPLSRYELRARFPAQRRHDLLRFLQPPAKPSRDTPPPFESVPIKPPVRPSGERRPAQERPERPERPERRRGRRVVHLPWPLPRLLIIVTILDAISSVVLYEIVHRAPSCDTRVCRLVTHGHPQVTLALAIGSSVALIGMACGTALFQEADALLVAITGLAVPVAGYAMSGFAVGLGVVGAGVFLVCVAMVAADGPVRVVGTNG